MTGQYVPTRDEIIELRAAVLRSYQGGDLTSENPWVSYILTQPDGGLVDVINTLAHTVAVGDELRQSVQQDYAAIAAKQQRDAARIAELEAAHGAPLGHVVVAVVEGREPFIHGNHRHVMTAADAIRSVGRSDLPRGMTLKVCELREVTDRA